MAGQFPFFSDNNEKKKSSVKNDKNKRNNRKHKKKSYPKQCFLCDDPTCTEWKKCKTFTTHRTDPKDPTKRLLLKDIDLEDGKFPASVCEKDILPKMRESRKKRMRKSAKSRSAIKKSITKKSPVRSIKLKSPKMREAPPASG